MTFDVLLHIDDQSPEGSVVQSIMRRDSVSPEEAVMSLLKLSADPDNYDHIFTPELIAKLEAEEEEARDGNNLTVEQVMDHFETKRQAWHANHHV